MEAGKLLHRIKFVKRIKTTSESGGTSIGESEILNTRFADYRIEGETAEVANEIQYKLNRIIHVRFNKLITKDCYCLIDNEKYSIDAMIPDRRRNRIKLYLVSVDK